ncbi:MAG: penicillin-binding protein activator [Candidatus Desulfatibia sp.]|uniref:ABC transporter substrate-binding protein n=1 Tax=Candidatus Desulfatibia sp. TaxID=3101189 RepID=UPI002F2D01A6
MKSTKPIAIILLLLLEILLGGCLPKTTVLTVPGEAGPGKKLYSKAEKLFQAKSYREARESYNEYLARFQGGPLAAGAFLKIGAIHAALGSHSKARDVYQRLIAEYPGSSFAQDARVGILISYYNEGMYSEVIEQAADFLKGAVPRAPYLRTHLLLGDTYLAMGSPVDAVTNYVLAYKKSKDSEKEGIISQLEEAAVQLDSEEFVFLLNRTEDGFPAGYLLYQLGLNHLEEEEYEYAERVLSIFIENFPGHARSRQAQSLLETISKKSVYSRYTIGCLLPISGRYRAYGNRALKGVEFALNRFSSQNIDHAIKIIFKDTGSDPDRAAEAVKELFKENVAAIIGPLVTAETAGVEAQHSGIPIVTLTQKEGITQIGDYVFRNFFTPAMQVKTIVSFAVESLGLQRFAILYPDENYGTTFMNLFWDEVLAHRGRIVGVESYNSTHTDFADPIKKLVGLYYEVPEDLKAEMHRAYEAENDLDLIDNFIDMDFQFADDTEDNYQAEEPAEEPADEQTKATDQKDEKEEEPEPIIDFDAVFIPDAPAKSGLIIPQLAYYDVKDIYLLGTNLWHSDNLIEMSRQYAQGAVMTDGFFAQSASANVKDFVKDFRKTYGENPGFIEAVAYDTAMILFKMVSRPEMRYRSALKKGLMQLSNYEGVTGLTSFDSSGEVRKKLFLLQIKGRGFVELERHEPVNSEQQSVISRK